MRVIVTGSTGLIGKAVVEALGREDCEVFRLVRPPCRADGEDEILWRPTEGFVDGSRVDGCDAIIHLAGENVAGRWTRAKKERIYQSRVKTTNVLYDFIARLKKRPHTFVAASGISYCGDCGDRVTDEDTPKGQGFLCDVTERREETAMKMSKLGARVVMTRFAMVLSPRGGGLKKLLPAFRSGLGGVLGTGQQYWPWVSLDDAAAAVIFALKNGALRGAVNVVAPQSITNAEFTDVLGRVLGKPTRYRKPERLVRFVLGQFAEELLLVSNRAAPRKLLEAGFEFQDADLGPALERMLGKRAREAVSV